MSDKLEVRVPVALLLRICSAFLEMQAQGADTRDATLMEDLDKILGEHDRMVL